jgi:nucleotide-binding universal stress UspA family protein
MEEGHEVVKRHHCNSRKPRPKMKIICGTDFSEGAEQASLAAAALARRLGDTLVLAHVWDKTLSEGLFNDFYDRMSAAVRNRLYEHAVRLRETSTSVKEEMFSADMPDVELAQMAARPDVRLLVVGSLGRRSGEWLLGSVAERTAMRAPAPTLVVRSAVPFEAWARGKAPLKIFIAFDFSGTAETALRWIKDVLAAGPCEIVVGYVDWPMGEAARLGISGEFLGVTTRRKCSGSLSAR